MKALVLYSKMGELKGLATAVAQGLEQADIRVDLREADDRGTPIAAGGYDMICVGSPVLGFWGGQVAHDVDGTLKRFVRLEGKPAAAFVKSKAFGTGKSLRKLMGLLERQGALVQDFAVLRGVHDARAFGLRLENLVKKEP